MDIADTDSSRYKEGLRQEKGVLLSIMAKLEEAAVVPHASR